LKLGRARGADHLFGRDAIDLLGPGPHDRCRRPRR
jgi:hypothetical protein